MALRTLLKFRNLDLTRSINDRFSGFISPGVISGGTAVPVSSQLKVDLLPYKAVSLDGMVVEETSDSTRLDCPAGQTTVVAVKMVYSDSSDPTVAVVGTELSAFNSLSDRQYYVVFCHVVVPLSATSIQPSYIDYSYKDELTTIGRNTFRGVLSNSSLLPLSDNRTGDYYMVVDGIGGPTHLYGWTGSQWFIMTDAAAVTSDLAAHRNNLFIDENHLTDDEKDAVAGTSGTAVGASNKLVDSADTRLPTQDENDALLGTDGMPSSSNKYVTAAYPIASPAEKTASPSGSFQLLAADGPVYVGKGGVGTANQYFHFYHATEGREYINSTNQVVSVSGVYTNSLLTVVLDPSLNPSVDSDGFFSGSTLYIAWDNVPDSSTRLMYGKRETLDTLPVNALLKNTLNDAQTSSNVITTVTNVKGRNWDVTPPTNEQNIELRKSIVSHQEYMASALRADFVVGDFDRVSGVPDFDSNFVENVGINQNYSFQNSGLISFTYNSSTGVVTYSGVVSLGSVVVGHVFIDSAGNEYTVTATGGSSVTITYRNGVVPRSISTTAPASSAQGSCKPDNNPRKINLSTLDVLAGKDRVYIREIASVPGEFSPYTGNVAFEIKTPVRSRTFKEPRVRLYGSFKNKNSGSRAKVVCSGTGRVSVTGFFNDLRMLVDLRSASPSVDVYTNGVFSSTIDLSRGGLVATLGTEDDLQAQTVVLVTGLQDTVPNNVEIVINNTIDDFVLYGFDLCRIAALSLTTIPGRAFVQTDLFKSDSSISSTMPALSTRLRGSVTTRYINRSLVLTSDSYVLTDVDGSASTPSGTPNGTATMSIDLSGQAKYANFTAGDIVRLIGPTAEETLFLSSKTASSATFSTSTTVPNVSSILVHLASTSDTCSDLDPIREYARFNLSDLGAKQSSDFSILSSVAGDKIFTLEDGTTSILGTLVSYAQTEIDGADVALSFSGSSQLRLRAVAVRCDIVTVNSSGTTITVSLDGSPTYTKSVPSGGTAVVTLWHNARYQTHEAYISSASGLNIVGFILYEPAPSSKPEGVLLSTQNTIAAYNVSLNTSGDSIPIGGVAIDPFTSGGVYTNPGWVYNFDTSLNPAWGRYATTDSPGAYLEYTFSGDGFEIEYLANSSFGKPLIYIDGVVANNANFPVLSYPSINFVGMTASTGEVDMYAASLTRKKFGISGLGNSRHTVRVQTQNPVQKNVLSSGYNINVVTFYEVNSLGSLSVTSSKGFRNPDFHFGMDSARDERNFDSVDNADSSPGTWAQPVTNDLPQNAIIVGDQTNTALSVSTSLLGDIKAASNILSCTVTIAAPGVFTTSAHGLATGDKIYLITNGSLPTGLSTFTTYYASVVSSTTFRACTTLANAIAGTGITTSGSQSGNHSVVIGGLTFTGSPIPGRTSGVPLESGYTGQILDLSGSTSTLNAAVNLVSLSVPKGAWDIKLMGSAQFSSGSPAGTDNLTLVFTTTVGPTLTGTLNDNKMVFSVGSSGTGSGSFSYFLDLAAPTTYYLHGQYTTAALTGTVFGRVRAVRRG